MADQGTNRWGPSRALAALCVALLVVLGVPAAASAATDGSATTTQGDAFDSGAPVTLIVTIAADAATSGTIVVRDDAAADLARLDVDVPGGSERQFLLTVQPTPWAGQLRVRYIPDGGSEILLDTIQVSSDVARTVAAIGSVSDRLANDSTGAWPIRISRIDPSWLGTVGVQTLSGVDNVVAAGRDLAQLTPAALTEIEWYVWGGGRLVIVDPAGAPPELLDRQWGVGSVVTLPSVSSSADLDDVLRNGFDVGIAANEFGQPVPGSLSSLAADSGYSTAGYGVLLLAVLGYIALVGPALWILLRRRRCEPLFWLAAPALALTASLVIWGIGSVRRSSVDSSYASVVIDGPNGGVEVVDVLLASTTGGFESIEIPSGWRPVPAVTTSTWGNPTTAGTELRGDRYGVELDPGGIGMVRAERWLPSTPTSFEIQVEVDGSDLEGTITNATERRLQEVTVQSGAGFRNVGDLGPGESVEFRITNVDQQLFVQNYLVDNLTEATGVWNGQGDDGDPPVSPGTLGQILNGRPALAAPGSILVAGWAADAGNGLTSGNNGRNAFATSRPIAILTDDTGPPLVEASISHDTSWAVDGSWLAYTAQLTPAAEVLADMPLLVTPRGTSTLQVWDGSRWMTVGEGTGEYVVLDEWVRGGSIRVRVSSQQDPWVSEVNLPVVTSGGGS